MSLKTQNICNLVKFFLFKFFILNSFMSSDQDDSMYAIRIGSLVLYNIGQLLPHQINSSNFHTRDFIYPVCIS